MQVHFVKDASSAPVPAEPPPPEPPPAPDEHAVHPANSPLPDNPPVIPSPPPSMDSGRVPADCCVVQTFPCDQGREPIKRNHRRRRSTKKVPRHKRHKRQLSSLDTDSESVCSSDSSHSSDSGRDEDDCSVDSIVGVNALDCVTGNYTEIDGVNPTTNPEHRPQHFDCDGDRALIDSGAWATCTNQRNKLHGYREYTETNPCRVRLCAAIGGEERTIIPVGYGYLHVPCNNASGFMAIFCLYHPALNTTIIDERSIGRAGGIPKGEVRCETIEKRVAAGTCCVKITHKTCPHKNVYLDGILQNGKAYTHPLIPVYDQDEAELTVSEDPEFASLVATATLANVHAYQTRQESLVRSEMESLPTKLHKLPFHTMIQDSTPVNAIRAETLRLLWHQRLGHCSDHYLYNAHKHIKGVPQFKHLDPILDTCPTCIRAKQTKEPAGHNSTRTATVPYQGLSADFGFAGVRSADSSKNTDFLGFNNETAWILVSDHATRMKHGATRMSKASPLAWLRSFLTTHAPDCDGKYVFLDQGGELYRNPKVVALFEEFGYTVRPTGADSSNQNGPVERGHLTVANAVRAFLIGSSLDVRFWPYAFHHWINIDNALPSRDQPESPLMLAGEPQPDFSRLRTFGCRVWVRPPGRRRRKFVSASRKGIFLGFLPNTTTNILWYDPETNRVKIAKHARFDEGMNDLPATLVPPNVVHLGRVQQGDGLTELEEHTHLEVPRFDCHIDPFPVLCVKTIKRRCNHANYGMEFATDDLNNRAYVHGITKGSSIEKAFSTRKAATNKLIGAYIVRLNDEPVFTAEDVRSLLQRFNDDGIEQLTVQFAIEKALSAQEKRRVLREHNIFAPEDPDLEDEHVHQLTIEDIRHITAVRHPENSFGPENVEVEQIHLALNAISSTTITDSERALGTFTRRKLKTLETWPEWKAGETKQLDHFEKLGMYGTPQARPPGAIVLRPHWQYQLKRDGTRRSRNCCDGSKRAAPLLHKLAKTHSSCVEQPVQRLFFALSAHLGYRLYAGDAQDAYAHSPGLYSVPTYVSIDDAYAEWYFDKFNVRLDRSMVLPVLSALQGHPEAGRLWETHINKILKEEFNFQSTIHDKCIYRATVDNVPVLLLRQVDDFALACPDEALAKKIYDRIGRALQRPDESEPPFKYLGPMTDFNGVDITQYDDTLKISCANYIDRVMQTHGWGTPLRQEATKPGAPLQSDHSISRLYKEHGFGEDSEAHDNLVAKFGFVYRQLLGELLYAYVTCRPDIGYAVITLSKFASKPGEFHFQCLKDVALYLRRTKHWGITYHKRTKDTNAPFLPPNPETFLVDDPDLPPFPKPDINDLTLACYVDAAHANDERTRRSTTGYSFQLAGGTIAYRCKTQTVTATSSTEAEFYAAVSAAKQAKYLRAILHDLGYPQLAATILYCDNESAIKMINADIPTERSRHIDIQWFAIQDWKHQGHIIMEHIPGKINPADDFTKPLGWVLHARHARRTMGHYRP